MSNAYAPIRFILPVRDMLQSLYGGKISHNSPQILSIYEGLKAFNEAGPVQIAGVEGHGGALPQYDVMQERYPLVTAGAITKALDASIVQRPLIRGPFGVMLNPLHRDDLKWTLRQMAQAGGATAGHQVVFKLFEAQNRPVEYLDSLKIINGLRKDGYNVACEVAMVVSDKPDLNAQHYKQVAQGLLDPEFFKQHDIDPATVVGFSLKDMIGGVKATRPEHDDTSINARNLATIAMDTIQRFHEATGQKLYLGWHTHEIGNGVDCLAEAGQTFSLGRQSRPGITEFQQDAIMGSPLRSALKDFGFVDLEKLLERYKETNVSEGMSERQQEIWNGFKIKLFSLVNQADYRASYIDASKWSKGLLEYGQLASGGLPYVEANGIAPYIKHVSKMETSLGSGEVVGEEKAPHILRCLFASINGVLARDLGNAHSVTPAMKLLNDLTINVVGSLLRNPEFIQKHIQSGTNWSVPLQTEEDQREFEGHYSAFRNVQAMAYFCTTMPTEVSPPMLQGLRQKLFDYYFPKDYESMQKAKASNSASMLKEIGEDAYGVLRTKLAECLLDKKATRALLIGHGVADEVADEFVTSHIGVNSLPVNHGVRARLGKVGGAVSKLIELTGGELVVRSRLPARSDVTSNILFSSLLMRGSQGKTVPDVVVKLASDTPFRKHHFRLGTSNWQGEPTRDSGQRLLAAIEAKRLRL